MNSSLPFFLFWMAGSMSGMIASDYRRGLSMLKDLVETGDVPSATEIDGSSEVEAAHYVGMPGTARFDELSDAMRDAFARCAAAVGDGVSGTPFVIYQAMDFKRSRCTFVACLPTGEPTALDGAATRPACTALRAVHTGAYRHLGNAWSMLMAEARHRKLKPSRQLKPFERYLNDATQTDESELVTELFLPLR